MPIPALVREWKAPSYLNALYFQKNMSATPRTFAIDLEKFRNGMLSLINSISKNHDMNICQSSIYVSP